MRVFIWGLANDIHICKSYKKSAKHVFQFDPRNNTISNLCGQSQCKSITIRLTTLSFKAPKQFDLLWNT